MLGRIPGARPCLFAEFRLFRATLRTCLRPPRDARSSPGPARRLTSSAIVLGLGANNSSLQNLLRAARFPRSPVLSVASTLDDLQRQGDHLPFGGLVSTRHLATFRYRRLRSRPGDHLIFLLSEEQRLMASREAIREVLVLSLCCAKVSGCLIRHGSP